MGNFVVYYYLLCYNIFDNEKEGVFIFIHKTKAYERDLRKKIIAKHKISELEKITHIESLIKSSDNMQKLINSSLAKIYGIKKKNGDLREIYTADLNKKIRLYMKPESEYPYDLAGIEFIEFVKIDDKHYGEG